MTHITKRNRVERTRWNGWINETVPGELLYMSNGEKWFHPFNGSQPINETE